MARKTLAAVLFLFPALLGLAAGSWAGPGDLPPGLTRADPVRCTSVGDVVLHRRYIETVGNGVELHGACDARITDSYIVAGGIGVLSDGAGDVRIENSTVEGAQGGLVTIGAGDISFRSTKVKGGTRASGTGQVFDLGGNQVSGSVSSGAGAPRGGVEIKGGKGSIVVGDDGAVTIGGRRDTLTVRDGNVTLTDGRTGSITAREGTGDVTIQGPEGSIYVERGYVRLSSGGSTLTIKGDWRNASSRYGSSDTPRLMLELNAAAEAGLIHFDLAGDVLFNSGSTAVRSDAQEQLGKVAHVLRQKAAGEISVIGHTDSVGNDDSNQKLSEGRAVSVMRWLNEHERIPADLMRGQGLGEKQPIAYNARPDGGDNPGGRAQNRRVEIRFAATR